MSPVSVENWYRSGERLAVTPTDLPERTVFVRRAGSGPVVTLVHGFPTSSWDWARTAALLERDHTVITLDLLGYGESDKPWKHTYSTAEHASIVESVWRALDVESSILVGHDVGTSVAQELLARLKEGATSVDLPGVVLINGALFTDHYAPKRVTRLLASRVLGPVVARAMNRERFVASLSDLFSDEGRPGEDELGSYWNLLGRRSGRAVLPGLVHYLVDKQVNNARWSDATRTTAVPTTVVWGMRDSAIPTVVLDDTRRYLPQASFVEVAEAGHFPHIERPDIVAGAIRDLG
jgi:pimeloyl-ACP methyl ester carboxylesterase